MKSNVVSPVKHDSVSMGVGVGQVGQLISDAMGRVGRQGVVTMEESRTAEDHLYVVEGMQFERGYISPYFVTDPERMVCLSCLKLSIDEMGRVLSTGNGIAREPRELSTVCCLLCDVLANPWAHHPRVARGGEHFIDVPLLPPMWVMDSCGVLACILMLVQLVFC